MRRSSVGEEALGSEARSHPEQTSVDAADVGRRSRALPWEICPPVRKDYPHRKGRGWAVRSQQRAYEVDAATKGPNK
jgi:hypothetical protein